ncbi:MAG: TetR/AcrR family transcriptional regulator [Bacillota bacterium]
MPKETFFNLSEEKQEKVMRAAVHEFLTHGFEKGNIGDIAKNAGVAKGSMYQYFENKKELFLYCITWATKLMIQKYSHNLRQSQQHFNVFEYMYQNYKEVWIQLREEREVVVFLQDVFLGKYASIKDESMSFMMKAMDEQILKMIREGKENGVIRRDIDDNMLSLFMTGVSVKFKEYLMNKARAKGDDIIDEDFSIFEKEIRAISELMRNGMGVK